MSLVVLKEECALVEPDGGPGGHRFFFFSLFTKARGLQRKHGLVACVVPAASNPDSTFRVLRVDLRAALLHHGRPHARMVGPTRVLNPRVVSCT